MSEESKDMEGTETDWRLLARGRYVAYGWLWILTGTLREVNIAASSVKAQLERLTNAGGSARMSVELAMSIMDAMKYLMLVSCPEARSGAKRAGRGE